MISKKIIILILLFICNSMCINVYVNSGSGNDTLSGMRNNGLNELYPAKTIQNILGRWKNETYVTINIAAGTYNLNTLSFTKTEDFQLRWTEPIPILFGTYP